MRAHTLPVVTSPPARVLAVASVWSLGVCGVQKGAGENRLKEAQKAGLRGRFGGAEQAAGRAHRVGGSDDPGLSPVSQGLCDSGRAT